MNSLCRKKNYVFQDGENFTIMINENRRAQSASALLKWGGRPNQGKAEEKNTGMQRSTAYEQAPRIST